MSHFSRFGAVTPDKNSCMHPLILYVIRESAVTSLNVPANLNVPAKAMTVSLLLE